MATRRQYHGSRSRSFVEGIHAEGLPESPKSSGGGADFGEGLYFTSDMNVATDYAFGFNQNDQISAGVNKGGGIAQVDLTPGPYPTYNEVRQMSPEDRAKAPGWWSHRPGGDFVSQRPQSTHVPAAKPLLHEDQFGHDYEGGKYRWEKDGPDLAYDTWGEEHDEPIERWYDT